MTERPILFQTAMVRALLAGTKTQTRRVFKAKNGGVWPNKNDLPGMRQILRTCPYGQPGDRLFVREAFSYREGQGVADRGEIWYWADGRIPTHGDWTKPKPSIHMPRWACRILLEITAVRVERLGQISDEDARCEGVANAAEFQALWRNINNQWEPEQWVWVIQFQKANWRHVE